MGEAPVASAKAEVMMYNEQTKGWQSPDGSSENGLSTVRIMQNSSRQSFRIVAIRERDGVWVMDCRIHHKLKYHPANATFHQWRDEQRQVHGLSFSSESDAQTFLSVMSQAIEYLHHQSMHGGDYQTIQHDNVYQDPHQHHQITHNQSVPAFRDHEDGIQNGAASHPSFRKSSHSVQNGQMTNQQRRSSQGSSASSNGNGTNHLYAQQQAASASPSRVAPGVPPAPPGPPAPMSSAAPPAPPPPPIGGGAPPPPPPPPPPANLFQETAKTGLSLADQLNARKNMLNKTETVKKEGRSQSVVDSSSNALPSVTTIAAPPAAADMMSELAATINRRKINQAKSDAADSKSNISNGSSDSGCAIFPPQQNGFSNGIKKWESVKTNGHANNDSPKTHRKVPSGSSISSQEETVKMNGMSPISGPVTVEYLEKFRAEMMADIRSEMNRVKQEILEAIQEMNIRR